MAWAVGKAKPDFIGRRSHDRSDMKREDRKQLVGLQVQDANEVLPEGGQVVERVLKSPPMPMIGHITSSYWSETLKRGIALAMIAGGHARLGQTVHVPLEDRVVDAVVVSPVFYDPEGKRLHG
jgi:sarcosine oxidase subunit alpha